mmetsp:Transcript_21948/g.28424  ORF Transcript_21948/g.28424 Transcript_21948/m.28424 type:complete len:83 (+) Transcript_21948:219-467(+)
MYSSYGNNFLFQITCHVSFPPQNIYFSDHFSFLFCNTKHPAFRSLLPSSSHTHSSSARREFLKSCGTTPETLISKPPGRSTR